jgi:hypothetical protein
MPIVVSEQAKLTQSVLGLTAAVLIATAGCTDAVAVERASRSRIRLSIVESVRLNPATVDVVLTYQRTDGAPGPLVDTRLPIAAGQQDLDLEIDLLPCLLDASHTGETSACTVDVDLTLRDAADIVLDRQIVGPLTLVDGTSTAAQPVTLRGSLTGLHIGVDDPIGDHGALIDVILMILRFDNLSGAYEIEITTSPNAPFIGDFRINVNLFNVDAVSFFSDAVNDYSLTSPVTRIILTDTSSALLTWSAGDRIHTNSLAGTPNPPGGITQFACQVFTIGAGLDHITFRDLTVPAIVVAPASGSAALTDGRL